MKTITVSVLIVITLIVLLIIAVATGASGLALIPFCGWTPAIFLVGWSVGRTGIKFKITTAEPERQAPVSPVTRRKSRLENVG